MEKFSHVTKPEQPEIIEVAPVVSDVLNSDSASPLLKLIAEQIVGPLGLM
mgnify:CR=1 FL=1